MEVEKILSEFPKSKDYLLEILHEIQNKNPNSYIPPEVVQKVAKHLNIKKAQVYGVIGYYSMFSDKPRGKYVIRICASPVCSMMGAENLIEYLEKKLNVKVGETTPDELFTLETSECLGNCAAAPAMMVNLDMYGNLTPGMVDNILKQYSQNK
ncbi:NADH-quinone oxidoreductase subunit NuoE [Tenuifilum thalassicum]|uniref:NADH-quinone oxidoreductase subunit NuoE n=2 Tax=Tenuifilum thalassicum TaxID=2590900 RepID=A0A7D4BEX2_9BACT|nr:NADH-quinone oxidoreductase subunit NuoE [Tenuifilum thalassicum]